MARDECVDCEARPEGGKDLTQGRCPTCRKAFLARRREAAPSRTEPRKKGK